jgi:hypothetical protein
LPPTYAPFSIFRDATHAAPDNVPLYEFEPAKGFAV